MRFLNKYKYRKKKGESVALIGTKMEGSKSTLLKLMTTKILYPENGV